MEITYLYGEHVVTRILLNVSQVDKYILTFDENGF